MHRVSQTHVQAAAGALAIRIWVEQISPMQLRARITHSSDVEGSERIMSSASSTDEIEKTVRLWLESFVGSIKLLDAGLNA